MILLLAGGLGMLRVKARANRFAAYGLDPSAFPVLSLAIVSARCARRSAKEQEGVRQPRRT